MDLNLTYGVGFNRTTVTSPPPNVNDPNYLDYLADDQQFMSLLTGSMRPNHLSTGAPDAYHSIVNAAADNVGSLSVEERAQIIQWAARIPAAGYRSDPTDSAKAIVKSIESMSNNQGYTGPDAGVVVTATPTAGGYPLPITRGQILDNENFGNLVDSVFTAAGGKSSLPANLQGRGLAITGMPGSAFTPAGPQGVLIAGDMTKWSEAERIDYLNKVAEFGKDGTMSSQEAAQLGEMAGTNIRNDDNEPIAVTSTSVQFFGKSGAISKDDLMENGTFEKQLNSIALWGEDGGSTEAKALKDAIATANYDALGYKERVALIQAFNSATGDNNVTAEEMTAITTMLENFQKSGNPGHAASVGTTLSNGLAISDGDVKTDKSFMSLVNSVLDRSGVTTAITSFNSTNYYSGTPFSDNQSTIPTLRSLDVSKLTPTQRIEVLEMISQAASDRQVTRDEANAISKRVSVLSGCGSQSFLMV
jgi:hypothetical protein